MLRGLANVSYFADDVAAARGWYRDLLGVDAYFARPEAGPPMYVEFRVGDTLDELGIVDSRFRPPAPGGGGSGAGGSGAGGSGAGGAILYWHVDDPAAALEDLLARGATLHDPVRERGEGFVTASVVDPFGNVLGVMYNPHYVEMLEAKVTGSDAP